MKNNTKGITHILMLVAIVGVIVALAMFYIFTGSGKNMFMKYSDNDKMMEGEPIPSASPVSESTDFDVIEAEIDGTILVSPDADLDAMGKDASSL